MGLFSEALDSPQPTSLGSLCFGAEQAQAYLCIIATELQGKDYSPKKITNPEDPSTAGWQLSNQDPQIPTLCFC